MSDEERIAFHAAMAADDNGVAARAFIDARIVAAIKATPEWHAYAAEIAVRDNAMLYGTGDTAEIADLLAQPGTPAIATINDQADEAPDNGAS